MGKGYWVSRICPECGEEISLWSSNIREACNLDGELTIKCPKCGKGKIKYSVTPPLTKGEITAKALKDN